MTSSHTNLFNGAAGGIGNANVAQLLQHNGVNVEATDLAEGPLKAQKENHGDRLKVVVGDIVDVR